MYAIYRALERWWSQLSPKPDVRNEKLSEKENKIKLRIPRSEDFEHLFIILPSADGQVW